MLNRKDYPYFSFFMDRVTAFSDCIDDPGYKLSKTKEIYAEFTKMMKAEGWAEECIGLKADIIKLKEKNIDVCDMQAFIIREYGLRFKQKEIPIVFDKILEGLES